MAGKRVIRLHRALSLVVGVLATIVIAVMVYQKSGLLSRQLSNYVNSHYLQDSPFRFSCGRVSGDVVGHITIARPVLRYQTRWRSVEIFRAGSFSVDYDLMQVLKLKMLISNLELHDVRIRYQEDEDGNPMLPALPVSGGGEESAPQIVVENFVIDGLQVRFQRGEFERTLKDVVLRGAFRLVGDRGDLEIREGQALVADSKTLIRSFDLKATFKDGAFDLRQLNLRTDRTFLMASGRYDHGRLVNVQGIFNPLDIAELTKLGVVSGESGEVGGDIMVNGRLDSLAVVGNVTGKAIGLVISGASFEGVVEPNRIHLSNMKGTVFGSRLNGEVDYRLGDGSFSFRGVCEHLDLTEGFLPDRGLPKTDLNGFIKLEHDAAQDAYKVRADLRRSVIADFESEALRATLEWRDATGLVIRSVALSRPGFELSGYGTVDLDENVELFVGIAGQDLSYVFDYIKVPRFGGGARLSGRLIGPIDRMQVNLSGEWSDLTYGSARIDSGRVQMAASNVPSDDVAVTVDVSGRHLSLTGREFSKPHVLLDASLEEIVIRDFSFSKGDTFLTSSFVVHPDTLETTIAIKHFVVQMPHSNWKNERESILILTDAASRIDSFVLISDSGRLGVRGSYAFGSGRCDIRSWGEGIDLALIREALALPIGIEGSGRFEATIRGDVSNPDIELSADLGEGVVGRLSFDSLGFRGGVSADGYRVERLLVRAGADSVRVTGTWQFADSPVRIAQSGFRDEAAQQAPIDVTVRSYGYPLSTLVEALHLGKYWGAGFRGDVTLSHTLGDPVIRVQGDLVSTARAERRLPTIATDLEYRNGELLVHSVAFDDGNNRGSVSGRVPMRLGLTSGLEMVGNGPLRLETSVFSNDLSKVSGYFERVATAGGELDGQLAITGTWGKPQYAGTLRLDKGSLRLAGTEETYRGISAVIQLENRRIGLASLRGASGKKGRFSGAGSGRFDGFKLKSYDLTLNLEEFTLTTIPEIEVTQDATLRIVSEQNARGRTVPSVTGAVRVRRALITKPLGEEQGPPSPVTLPSESPSWLCNLSIDAPKNVWVRNTDLDMELGGKLIMRRDTQGLYFRGDLRVLRGAYSLYNNSFRVTDGRIDFSRGTGVRPEIRLNAYTPHRRPGQAEHRILLDITWLTDKPEPTIKLSYDTGGYSEVDLWKMLGGQVVAGDAGLGSNQFNAGGAATNIASSYLERILNTQMRNTTIDVESRTLAGTSGSRNVDRELSIAVGRYLSEDLYFRYRQGLRTNGGRQVDIEYRISNMLLLRSEIIKHANRGLTGKSRQVTDEINFDIKFRFEY